MLLPNAHILEMASYRGRPDRELVPTGGAPVQFPIRLHPGHHKIPWPYACLFWSPKGSCPCFWQVCESGAAPSISVRRPKGTLKNVCDITYDSPRKCFGLRIFILPLPITEGFMPMMWAGEDDKYLVGEFLSAATGQVNSGENRWACKNPAIPSGVIATGPKLAFQESWSEEQRPHVARWEMTTWKSDMFSVYNFQSTVFAVCLCRW